MSIDQEFSLSAGDDDVIVTQNGRFRINGLGGNDRIFVLAGTTGGDVLDGGAGNDELVAAETDDVLIGGPGADVLDGGEGTDTADYSLSSAGILITLPLSASFPARGSGGDATRDSLRNIENLTGSAFADRLTGDAGANLLVGNGGSDRLRGGDGDDHLFGDFRNEAGSSVGDVGDNDVLDGGFGNDRLYGGGGDDFVNGGFGDDFLFGEDGNDRLNGGFGNNTLDGGRGNDLLTGGGDVDLLYGGEGNDQLYGSLGDDLLHGGPGADRLDGSAGSDTASYAGEGPTFVDLATGQVAGAAAGDLLISIENLVGGDFGDLLRGNSLANSLSGGGGSDTLVGREGDDVLVGGAGGDILDGGAGLDTADYGSNDGGIQMGYFPNGNRGAIDAPGSLDQIFSVERIIGSDFGDLLLGSGGDDELVSGASLGGIDELRGNGGADTLVASGPGVKFLFGERNPFVPDPVLGAPGLDTYQIVEGTAYIFDFEPGESIVVSDPYQLGATPNLPTPFGASPALVLTGQDYTAYVTLSSTDPAFVGSVINAITIDPNLASAIA